MRRTIFWSRPLQVTLDPDPEFHGHAHYGPPQELR
jgi:hypothetical protein